MESCQKELMGEIVARGNLDSNKNAIRVWFMPAVHPCEEFPEGLSPKVSHEITTNEDVHQKPRSFRTAVIEDQAKVVLADVRAYMAFVNGKPGISAEGRIYLKKELKARIWREIHV